jgi:hypothetical protein
VAGRGGGVGRVPVGNSRCRCGESKTGSWACRVEGVRVCSANGVSSKGAGTAILLVRAPPPCTAVPLRSLSLLVHVLALLS